MSHQAKAKVLVLGWYGHGNLGDESFRASFKGLWPQCDFDFMDHVPEDLSTYKACMVGGGSFLDQTMHGIDRINIPTAFVGVGVGGHVSEGFNRLLCTSKAIILRDDFSAHKLPGVLDQSKIKVVSDLFYSRNPDSVPKWRGTSKTVSVFLSEHLAPKSNTSPDWKDVGWHKFVKDMSLILDDLCHRGFEINFIPFSITKHHDDRLAAAAVVSRMVYGHRCNWYFNEFSEAEVLEIIASSRLVISTRLHGMIFASSVGCPFIAVCGHDKAHAIAKSNGWNHAVSMYGMDYQKVIESVDELVFNPQKSNLDGKFKLWHAASEFVAAKLSLS